MSDEPVDVAPEPVRRRGIDPGSLVSGVVVAVVGVLLLVAQSRDLVGQYIPLLVGAILLVAFFFTKQYGFLVPGAIITAVGVGTVLVANDPSGTRGPLFLVALGLGFVSIWVLGQLFHIPENHWWPLVPGGILMVIGAVALLGGEAQHFLDYWPLVLVIIGVGLVARALMRRQSD